MYNQLYRYLLALSMFAATAATAQPTVYTSANAHSHNDYEKEFPFWQAYKNGFGSIEADIFLVKDTSLVVAHDSIQLTWGRTIDSLYFKPLETCIQKNNGFVYADTSKQLQLLIDVKSWPTTTLQCLLQRLKKYPLLTTTPSLHIVITGNRPDPELYATYPDYISFDGELSKKYTNAALNKIVMLSDNFQHYTKWNGKGRLPEKEQQLITNVINSAHQLHKKVRFWNAPDIINSWYAFLALGVDYVNTDHIESAGTFFRQLPDRTYTATTHHVLYKPLFRNDGTVKPVKNIILLIGDGTGLAQWYAGYTANKGALNVFNMRHTSLSKTSSFDNYITDSAPGATALSTGTKTNNRAVGVDNVGKPLILLPQLIKGRKMKTGIITSGDLRDATPASFYAHQPERSNYAAILEELINAPVDFIAGAGDIQKDTKTYDALRKTFQVVHSIDNVTNASQQKILVADPTAGRSASQGRGDWSEKAFTHAVNMLEKNKEGFFLMLEGAQIDHGGHANKLPYVASEVMDFDRVIGEAMKYADTNGETLVIVTADHETGGLTLTGGDYSKGYISGQFSTEDHTAILVPVFAYGPQAQLFEGVYENTAIFYKMLEVLHIKP